MRQFKIYLELLKKKLLSNDLYKKKKKKIGGEPISPGAWVESFAPTKNRSDV